MNLFITHLMISEIDAVIDVLSNKLSNIWIKTKGSAQGKGDIGEIFVKYGVKQCFFDKGYKIRVGGIGTFAVYKQVNKKGKGRGGIDFCIDYTNLKNQFYPLLLEVKNWKHYQHGISPSDYKVWIYDRFNNLDPQRDRYWILAINTRNVKYIYKHCKNDKINIIRLQEHLTNQYIYSPLLDPIFIDFMSKFDSLIKDIELGIITK